MPNNSSFFSAVTQGAKTGAQWGAIGLVGTYLGISVLAKNAEIERMSSGMNANESGPGTCHGQYLLELSVAEFLADCVVATVSGALAGGIRGGLSYCCSK